MKTHRIPTATCSARRGAALLYAAIIAILIGGLCIALLGMNLSSARGRTQTQDSQRSFYAAEGGLSDAFVEMGAGHFDLVHGTSFQVGTELNPRPLGGSSYWVDIRKVGLRAFSLDSTGVDGRNKDRLELVLSEAPTGFFQYAAFGADGVVLDSNAFIDSYDSANGSYASQVLSGHDYALENGNLGSNADIKLSSNTQVHGDARPGPGHVVIDSAPGIMISGSTDPADAPFAMPPIVVPTVPSSGSINGSASVTLGPGQVHKTSITVQGGSTLTIHGPATVIADDFKMYSNSNLVLDPSAGPITFYSTGDFQLLSNATVTTVGNSAAGVTIMLSGNNLVHGGPDRMELSANSNFFGAIYAPNAKFRLGSNFNVYGSVICRYLDLSSNGHIHFDEALLYDGWGATHEYLPELWRRLPRA